MEWLKQTDAGVEITLHKPLTVDGTKIPVITMREPTVRDQLAMDAVKGGDAMKETSMLANLCMLTTDQVQGLTLKDYKRLQAAFMGFID